MVRDISKIPVGDYKVVGKVTDELLIEIMEKEKILPVGWEELYVCGSYGLLEISDKIFVKVNIEKDIDKITLYVKYEDEEMKIVILDKKENSEVIKWDYELYNRVIEVCNKHLVDKLGYKFYMELSKEGCELIIKDGVSDEKLIVRRSNRYYRNRWGNAYKTINLLVKERWSKKTDSRHEKIRFDKGKYFSYYRKWIIGSIEELEIETDMVMLVRDKSEVKVYYKSEEVWLEAIDNITDFEKEPRVLKERFLKEYEKYYVGSFKVEEDECLMLFKNIDVEDLGIKPKYNVGVFNIV